MSTNYVDEITWLRAAAEQYSDAMGETPAEAIERGATREQFVNENWQFWRAQQGSDFEPLPEWWSDANERDYESHWSRRFNQLVARHFVEKITVVCKKGRGMNRQAATVEVIGFQTLTPRAARAALQIAGFYTGEAWWSRPMVDGENQNEHGYRVYANSARKFYNDY